jgi:hypothetical protein
MPERTPITAATALEDDYPDVQEAARRALEKIRAVAD